MEGGPALFPEDHWLSKISLLRHFISALNVSSWPSDYRNVHVKSHQDEECSINCNVFNQGPL